MSFLSPAGAYVIGHPAHLRPEVLKAFRANQGLLLAGAVAYYALLSIVPLLILIGDRAVALRRPGGAARDARAATSMAACRGSRAPIVAELSIPRRTADVIGWVLLRDDAVLQLARLHRAGERDVGDLRAPRRGAAAPLPGFGADAVLLHPAALGVGLLLVTLVAGSLQAMGEESVDLLGCSWSLHGRLGRAAVPARAGGRDLRAHLDLPGDAGRAAVGGATRWSAA